MTDSLEIKPNYSSTKVSAASSLSGLVGGHEDVRYMILLVLHSRGPGLKIILSKVSLYCNSTKRMHKRFELYEELVSNMSTIPAVYVQLA